MCGIVSSARDGGLFGLSMMALSNSNRDQNYYFCDLGAIMIIGAVHVDRLIVHGRPRALYIVL